MAAFTRFEDINVWQNARVLVKEIYDMTGSGDFSHDFGLKDQIRRASVSICSSIAEGFERRGNKEFVYFLWIARGSSAEVCSQLYNARDLGYISQEKFKAMYDSAKQIAGMQYNLIATLSPSKGSTQQ